MVLMLEQGSAVLLGPVEGFVAVVGAVVLAAVTDHPGLAPAEDPYVLGTCVNLCWGFICHCS